VSSASGSGTTRAAATPTRQAGRGRTAAAARAGFLYDDGTGNDTYSAGDDGTNGGSFGSGFLLDTGAQDHYTAGPSGTAIKGVNGGGDGGHGLLLDVDKTQLGDTYLDAQGGTGTDKTVALKGLVGSQLDWTIG
jgi:hypothetical protein